MQSTEATASTPSTAHEMIVLLRDVFERREAESYLGEQVTISQHMLQGAALAADVGHDEAVVAGALLHDTGHYINEFPLAVGAT